MNGQPRQMLLRAFNGADGPKCTIKSIVLSLYLHYASVHDAADSLPTAEDFNLFF